MNIAIKLSIAERIRRARAADPSLTEEQLHQRFGANVHQVRAALAYEHELKIRRRA